MQSTAFCLSHVQPQTIDGSPRHTESSESACRNGLLDASSVESERSDAMKVDLAASGAPNMAYRVLATDARKVGSSLKTKQF